MDQRSGFQQPVDRHDHKHLIDLLSQLHDAMSLGKGNAVLGNILDELITYTATHFKREETLMQQIGYVDYVSHKAEHDKFVGEALALQNRFKTGAAMLTVSVFNFLSNWLRDHIKSRDVKLGQALLAKK